MLIHNNKTIRYTFRAEYYPDVKELFDLIPPNQRVLFVVKFDDEVPDVEVVLELNNMKLIELRNLMLKVQDGHVMEETVQHENDYTGNRYTDNNEFC